MDRLAALVPATAAACGSGGDDRSSGVDGTKLLIDLTSEQLDTLCTYVAEINGSERTFTCDGVTVKTGVPKQRCLDHAPTQADNPSCTLTVATFEYCYEVTAEYQDHPCDLEPDPACAGLGAASCQ